MSYDVIRSVRQLIESGLGDIARLKHILDRLENGKYLYLSDQKYLESLLNENVSISNKSQPTESHEFENLETELRDINLRLENILQNKTRKEKEITEEGQTVSGNDSVTSSTIINKDLNVRLKSEDKTLVFSVLLGLISLQGIGHIYIHKIAKGIGLLILSLVLSSLSVLYAIGMIKNSIHVFPDAYFIPILIGGYFGLYAFQILDSRKLCVAYNAYVSVHGSRPPWW